MSEILEVQKGQFLNIVKRRVYTIKKELRVKIRDEDYPDYDDALLIELRMLNTIARLHRIRRD